MFGGTGIQRERSAAGAGLCCPNWNPLILDGTYEIPGKFADEHDGRAMWDIGRSFSGNWDKLCKGNNCNPCSKKILTWFLNRDNETKTLSLDNPETFTDMYREFLENNSLTVK